MAWRDPLREFNLVEQLGDIAAPDAGELSPRPCVRHALKLPVDVGERTKLACLAMEFSPRRGHALETVRLELSLLHGADDFTGTLAGKLDVIRGRGARPGSTPGVRTSHLSQARALSPATLCEGCYAAWNTKRLPM